MTRRQNWRRIFAAVSGIALTASTTPTHAAFHLWQLKEFYSNADGSVQFVELITTFANQHADASFVG